MSVLLLDTCTLVWLTSDPGRLSAPAVEALEGESEIALSDVSVWEICLEWQVKKLELPAPPRLWIPEQVRAWHLRRMPIEVEHLFRMVELPDLHKDPFDRLLVSQALVRNTKIVTPDPAIRQYPVAVVW